jgi:hypothetical protein
MFDFWDHDNDSGGFFIFLYPIPLVRTPGGSLGGHYWFKTFCRVGNPTYIFRMAQI